MIYLKEYFKNALVKIDERNSFLTEFSKANSALQDKKNKRLLVGVSQLNLDKELQSQLGMNEAEAQQKEVAKKLLFTEETRKNKDFLDTFSFYNYSVFKELCQMEEYVVKSLIGNLRSFAEKTTKNITNNHIIFAELLTDINEVQKNYINTQANQLEVI